MPIMPTVPPCGQPASDRVEFYSPLDGQPRGSLDASLYTCPAHVAQVVAAGVAAGFSSVFHMPISGPKSCGDGFDFDSMTALTAAAPPAMSEDTLAEVRPMLVRYATHLAGGNRDRAEDAVQEALATAWTERDRWSEVREPAGWLMALTRYKVLAGWSATRRTVPADYLADVLPDDGADRDMGLPCLADDGVSEVIERAMQLLTPRQAEVVRGRFLDGLSLSEVGASMGVKAASVGRVGREALARLRESGPALAEFAGAR